MPTQIGSLGVTFPDNTVQTTAAIAGGSGFGGAPNVSIYTASAFWICPPGIYKVKVTVIGGGAGGYDAADMDDFRGGYGGCAVGLYAVVPNTTYNLVVGGGGLGFGPPFDQPNPNAPGGTSSFGSFCSATGGTPPQFNPSTGLFTPGINGYGINGTLGNVIYNPGYLGGGAGASLSPLSWSTTNGIGAGAPGSGIYAGMNGGVMIEWWG